jgi:hypothetical protein
MVKDQRLASRPARSGEPASSRRRQAVTAFVIFVVALAVVIVPHFLSMSPTTGEDNDPSNGVPPTSSTPSPGG